MNSEPENVFAGCIGIAGVVTLMCGLIRFTSIESQIMRGFGKIDMPGIMLIMMGGIFGLVGFLAAFDTSDSRVPENELKDHESGIDPLSVPETLDPQFGSRISRIALLNSTRSDPSVVYCTQCGKRIGAKAIFCSHCGAKVQP